jgi:hypothetical protein
MRQQAPKAGSMRNCTEGNKENKETGRICLGYSPVGGHLSEHTQWANELRMLHLCLRFLCFLL